MGAADGSPKDPILLIRTKWLSDEARYLGRGLGGVQKGGGDLLIDAIGADGRPIGEHEKLNDDIIIVGDEDAQALSDRVERLTNCYASLVTDFHQSHNHISDWMNGVGGIIHSLETYSLEEEEEEIHRLEGDGARAVETAGNDNNIGLETIKINIGILDTINKDDIELIAGDVLTSVGCWKMSWRLWN